MVGFMRECVDTKKIRIFVVLLLVILAGIGAWFSLCGQNRRRIRNVLLISIDTCRADHLSCYGYPHKTTPNIDAIADEGILFENVVSPIPLTLPAHSSMLTGTIPPYHGVHHNLEYQLGPSNLTMAEVLKDNGFTTSAVISAFILDSRFGLNQGFDFYNDEFEEKIDGLTIEQRRAEEASRFACDCLDENKDKRFFLFVHYYDPHWPYEPPEPFRSDYLFNPYAGEIAYTDYYIGQVLEKLKELNLYNSTLIIITSDHGESLGEHGEASHGYFIYQSCIKVPMIFKVPGGPRGKKVSDVVGLIDIVPTLLRFLGIDVPQQVQGKDISGYSKRNSSPDEDRLVFCESFCATEYQCNPLLGVVANRWKYIQTTRPELYDLSNDPEERNDLVEGQSQRARIMKDGLEQILQQTVREGESDSKLELDEEARKRLETLGYVASGTIDESFEFDQTKDDPKDYIKYHNYRNKVRYYFRDKQFDRAKEICRQMISERPNIAFTYVLLGDIAFEEKAFDEAISYNSQALRLDPENHKAQRNIGLALSNQNKFDEAVGHFKEALRLKADFRGAHYDLGVAYAHLGKHDDAIKHWNEALRLGENDSKVHVALADALVYQGKAEQAITHWKESLKLDPDNAKVHADLANILTRKGEIEEAILHLTESVRLNPNQPAVQNVLAELLYAQGKTEEAIGRWKQALHFQPDTPRILNNLAWIMAAHEDDKFRNPPQALQYAQKACELTKFKNPDLLDTISAAYAAVGKFKEAIQTGERALKLYRNLEKEKKADDLQNRLELFRAGRPYREKL